MMTLAKVYNLRFDDRNTITISLMMKQRWDFYYISVSVLSKKQKTFSLSFYEVIEEQS